MGVLGGKGVWELAGNESREEKYRGQFGENSMQRSEKKKTSHSK